MKLGLHTEQLFTLTFQHSLYRNTCPLSNHLCNIFRSNRFCDDRILDFRLTHSQFVNLLLRLGHLAISDLRNPAIIACTFSIMSLYLIILHLLTLLLQLRKDTLLLFPALPKRITLCIQLLQFSLDLVHLHGNTFPANSLPFNLQLPDPAIKLCYRLWYRIHFKTQL